MPEPIEGAAEPVEGAIETPVTEPAEPEIEPAQPEGDADVPEVNFMDLKTVPPELQEAAKKLQASHTKAMNRIHEEVLAKFKPEEKGEEPDPVMADRKAKVAEFIATEEGAAFKEVMMDLVKEYVGDTPQTVREMQIAKDVESVTAKYGEDNIAKNIDTIEEVAQKYPNAPLELVVRSVLYDGAKALGEAELKGKLQKKSEASDPLKPSPTGTVPIKKGTMTFEEAFDEAQKL